MGAIIIKNTAQRHENGSRISGLLFRRLSQSMTLSIDTRFTDLSLSWLHPLIRQPLMRHLQRVFDALPSAPAPNPDDAAAHKSGKKTQKSNIVSISVSPGISRNGTIAPLLQADRPPEGTSTFGFILSVDSYFYIPR